MSNLRWSFVILAMTTQMAQAAPPKCSNESALEGVKGEIRKEIAGALALSFESEALKAARDKIVPQGSVDIGISNIYAVSSEEDTRQCRATVELDVDGRRPNSDEVNYTVTQTEDGNLLYSVDFSSGYAANSRLFTGFIVENGLLKEYSDFQNQVLKTLATLGSKGVSQPQMPGPARAERLDDSPWGDKVRFMIDRQIGNSPVEGSGTVGVSFDISPTGDISNVKVTQGSGDAALDAAAVQLVERTGHVEPPPDQQAFAFSMKLSFL